MSFATHCKSAYWSARNQKSPSEFTISTNKKAWFNCDKCSHEFEMALCNISSSRESWCPFCARNKLCSEQSCEICYANSFVSSDKSPFWSSKNELTPREVFLNTHKKYLFNCNICFHEFNGSLAHISSIKKRWCPFCSHKILCNNNECIVCFKNSFASHPKSSYFSKLNDISPRQIFKRNNNKFIFNCDKCPHSFETSLSNISSKKGHWCPFCVHQKLCSIKECKMCFNNSFESHEKSIFWSKCNEKLPRQVMKSSNIKYIFECENNHESEMILSEIVNGTWCRFCKNKTESILLKFLLTMFNTEDIQKEFKIKDCINVISLRFDYYLIPKKTILELDGMQHFKQISNWTCPIETLKNDVYKMKCAQKSGIKVIRISQVDVWNNPDVFSEILIKLLSEPLEEQFTFLSLDPTLYDNHKKALEMIVD